MEINQVEMLSERAAAVWALGLELQQAVPVTTECLKKEWWDLWASGSDHIDVEVQAVLIEKSDSFQCTNIPSLRKLVDKHMFEAPVKQPQAQADAIAVDQFNLIMKQLKFDVTVFQNWEKKCSSVHAAREHARQEHRIAYRQTCLEAAKSFMDNTSCLLNWQCGPPEMVISAIMNFKRDVITRKTGADKHLVPSVVFLNWSAPCLVPAQNQDGQVQVLSWILNENMQSCGLVLYPVFTYMKGRLHLEESRATSQLVKGNHNIDTQFSVLFSSQCDARDLRPMVYPGRFVFPSPLGDLSKNMWFHSELRKSRRTPEVKQLQAKLMKEVEDLSPDALPLSTDTREARQTGAAKYCQLGPSAMGHMDLLGCVC